MPSAPLARHHPGSRSHRWPSALAALALALLTPLVAWNLWPARFPPRAHDVLAALPLALIALTYLLHKSLPRPSRSELLQALMLTTGFCLWAATQLWPELPQALLLNDIAIVLFVTELFLVIRKGPARASGVAARESVG